MKRILWMTLFSLVVIITAALPITVDAMSSGGLVTYTSLTSTAENIDNACSLTQTPSILNSGSEMWNSSFQAADNTTSTATSTPGAAGFFDSLPPVVWGVIGAVVGVLAMLIIVMVATPKKKKMAGTQQVGQAPKSRQQQGMPQDMRQQQRPVPPGQGTPHGQQPMQQFQGGQPMQQPPQGQPMQRQFQGGQPMQQPPQGQQTQQFQGGQPMQQPPQGQPMQPQYQQYQQDQPMQPRPMQPQQPAQGQPAQQFQGSQPMQQPPQGQPGQQQFQQYQQDQPMQPRPMQPQPGQGQPMQQRPLQPRPMQPQSGQGQPMQQQPMPPRPMQPRVMPVQPQPYTQQPVSAQMPYQQAPFRSSSLPTFSLSNLIINPDNVKEGDTVTISAVVTNTGAMAGQYSLVLRINSVVEKVNDLTINPGSNQTSTFTVVRDQPGEYYIELDGLHGMFVVTSRKPPSFSVSNLTIAPERVKQGEPVAISAVVTNSGETPGNYSVVLRIKGVAEGIEEVNLGPARSQRVTFNIIKDTAGFYPVTLENMTGKFVVEMDWKE